MAKDISRTTIQPTQTSLSEESGIKAKGKGKFRTKDAQFADSQVYHDKSAKSPEGQSLTNRTVIPRNLDTIVQLAEQGDWRGVSPAIPSCATTLVELNELVALLTPQDRALPSEIQKAIGEHFGSLLVEEVTPILIEGLTA